MNIDVTRQSREERRVEGGGRAGDSTKPKLCYSSREVTCREDRTVNQICYSYYGYAEKKVLGKREGYSGLNIQRKKILG
jgi:hypothetical protein